MEVEPSEIYTGVPDVDREILLKPSDNFYIHYKNDIPLVVASESGQYVTAKLLLENGANVENPSVGIGVNEASVLYVVQSNLI